MFKKILIANRGEIACRIIAAAQRMEIAAVAVYSDADKDALHVEMADESVPIGPPPAAQSYLIIERIISACKGTGAEAVHPGYGFLSEQAAFAQALAENQIAFIGPNAKAIAAMGDKLRAKEIARQAGVAFVPGIPGAIGSLAEAQAAALSIGYPIMIKAAAGGGGKGMRAVKTPEELAESFARAASEAKASFGDGRLFIEKLIAAPRHIEVQVLGDKHGNLIHLGERECSIQRRHQKLIEEAPSPFVDADMRAALGAQAIALAKAVNYDSAGTVEFIAGEDRRFYFLEMNTRLQVEHPVTELISGLDLVELMIRSAAGERLPVEQDEVRQTGWAIESRILAEDPGRNFLPSTGRLRTYREPHAPAPRGATLRIDSGVREGAEISIYYDPLIAKLVTHAQDRAAAIDAQLEALDCFVIEGPSTNVAFLSAVMGHERFRRGDISTSFIAEEYPKGHVPKLPEGKIARLFASVAAAADQVARERRRAISGQLPGGDPMRAPGALAVMLEKTRFDVQVERRAGGDGAAVRFETGETHVCASFWRPGEAVWKGTFDGEHAAVKLRPVLNGHVLTHGGAAAEARVFSRREAELAALMPEKKAGAGANVLRSPMPALVKAIAVVAGEEVKTGEPLCVIEAMKMEMVLRAGHDVTVRKINFAPGDSIAVDSIIMTFE